MGEIEDRLNKLRSPFRSAETFWIEEIIDPRDTRKILCEFVELAAPGARQRAEPPLDAALVFAGSAPLRGPLDRGLRHDRPADAASGAWHGAPSDAAPAIISPSRTPSDAASSRKRDRTAGC